MPRPVCLTIAGTDPTGGAGVAADLITFERLGCRGACVVTAVTVQNSGGVSRVHPVPPDVVAAQIDAVLVETAVAAIKIGMLGSAAVTEAVADRLAAHAGLGPIVVDPVLAATGGGQLLDAAGREALMVSLRPLAALITPNWPEALALAGLAATAADRSVAEALGGPVLITGGHRPGREIVDTLWQGGQPCEIRGSRLAGVDGHGTGCVLSAAIAARLALGDGLEPAVRAGVAFVRANLTRSATGAG